MKKDKTLAVEYKTVETRAIGSPELWGPAFWFTLHNSSAQYPITPSLFYREKMKSFILGLSCMIPCEKCAIHAASYLDQVSGACRARYRSTSKVFEGHPEARAQ